MVKMVNNVELFLINLDFSLFYCCKITLKIG